MSSDIPADARRSPTVRVTAEELRLRPVDVALTATTTPARPAALASVQLENGCAAIGLLVSDER
jgi:hypothetical protein